MRERGTTKIPSQNEFTKQIQKTFGSKENQNNQQLTKNIILWGSLTNTLK